MLPAALRRSSAHIFGVGISVCRGVSEALHNTSDYLSVASTLSSPCTMTATPMVRVVRPHEFCHANALPPSSVSNSMPNILLKFCPRQWLRTGQSNFKATVRHDAINYPLPPENSCDKPARSTADALVSTMLGCLADPTLKTHECVHLQDWHGHVFRALRV